jgi:Bacterial protein of unknown function (DUF839)
VITRRRPHIAKKLTILPAVAALAVAAITVQAAPPGLSPVASANTKSPGIASPNVLSRQLIETALAQGSTPLENPTAAIGFYGYLNNGPMVPGPNSIQSPGHNVEASKTEPDKNTYLVLGGQHGPDANYYYGRHFLYQGHELGAGYITRINLDADGAHKVTLLASTDKDGKPLPNIDGSTWDPFARRLLFTAELGSSGGVWAATPDFPSTVVDISGALGRGGYEGIQADSAGNLWIVEDAGGKAGSVGSPDLSKAKQPNSFVYRFVPYNRSDLSGGGKLQVLQAHSFRDNHAIVFGGTTQAQIDADIVSQDQHDLNTYGNTFATQWVTIHDTATDGSTPFDANAAAKSHGGTPFKRPENGLFRPGTSFREFFFDATGDTNALSPANAYGGWGGVFKLRQSTPTAVTGTLRLFYAGDQTHSGFDNTAWLDKNHVAFVEDAGDLLHTQRNALDSAYLLDARINGPQAPLRFLAEGRDASATIDSGLGSLPNSGFQNDGDNEITGLHVSDGNPTVKGLLGRAVPNDVLGKGDDHSGDALPWRVFWTQQHGDQVTYELLRK